MPTDLVGNNSQNEGNNSSPSGPNAPTPAAVDQVSSILACIKALPEAQQAEVWNHAPTNPAHQGNSDFDASLRSLLDTVVNASCMDENDVKVVATILVDSLSKLCAPNLMHHFVLQAMNHGVSEGSMDPGQVAEGVLACEPVNALLWRAPAELQPDAVAKLEQGHPSKIAKHQELNKLMVRRIIDLQTSETRKFGFARERDQSRPRPTRGISSSK